MSARSGLVGEKITPSPVGAISDIVCNESNTCEMCIFLCCNFLGGPSAEALPPLCFALDFTPCAWQHCCATWQSILWFLFEICFEVFAEIRRTFWTLVIVRAFPHVREIESYAPSKFQAPTTLGDYQNVEKTIQEKIWFFEFWKSVFSFSFLDFERNRRC